MIHFAFPDPYGPSNPHKCLIVKPLQQSSFLRIFPLTALRFIDKILFSDDGKGTTGSDRVWRRRSAPPRPCFGVRRLASAFLLRASPAILSPARSISHFAFFILHFPPPIRPICPMRPVLFMTKNSAKLHLIAASCTWLHLIPLPRGWGGACLQTTFLFNRQKRTHSGGV